MKDTGFMSSPVVAIRIHLPRSASRAIKIERTVAFEPGIAEIRMGRQPGLELSLALPGISRTHARLFREGTEWFLEDLDSTNGTYCGGVRLAPREKRLIPFGQNFSVGETELTLDTYRAIGNVTDRMETTRSIARRLVHDLFRAMNGTEVPTLRAESGLRPGDVLHLNEPERVYRVGRAATCDFRVDDPGGSRDHAGFVHRWDGVYVIDMGSKNGVDVAGRRIEGEHRLSHGELVRVGATCFRLDDPQERYLVDMAQSAVDSAPLHDPAAAPRPRASTPMLNEGHSVPLRRAAAPTPGAAAATVAASSASAAPAPKRRAATTVRTQSRTPLLFMAIAVAVLLGVASLTVWIVNAL